MSDELKEEIRKEVKRQMSKPLKVYIETCREKVKIPSYQHIGDAGMDIRSAVDIEIMPGETRVIPTGLKVIIPKGYEIQIRPRSGISLKTPLRLANSIGTIDSGFRDEIGVIINNSSRVFGDNIETFDINEKENREGIYSIKKGDRIAQMVFCKYEEVEFVNNKDLLDDLVKDRKGGFGHSGVR